MLRSNDIDLRYNMKQPAAILRNQLQVFNQYKGYDFKYSRLYGVSKRRRVGTSSTAFRINLSHSDFNYPALDSKHQCLVYLSTFTDDLGLTGYTESDGTYTKICLRKPDVHFIRHGVDYVHTFGIELNASGEIHMYSHSEELDL